MSDRKVLIVTYYWPPSGGSGVQRWLKFVKYLPQYGWIPVVVTPANPSFGIKDNSLVADIPSSAMIHRLPIWEPYGLFFTLARWFGKKELKAADFVSTQKSKSVFQQISTWIRGNLFIPDARVFWVRPAARFIEVLIREEGIDTIITTGPPHSMHLVGLRLKKKFPGLKWIADFRDPWSEWDVLDSLSLTQRSWKRHQFLEKAVLAAADHVTTIAPFHVERLEQLGGRSVELLTNGFDEDDFHGVVHRRTTCFTIRHIGVADELRDPRPFMVALLELCKSNPTFRQEVKVEYVGQVNTAFRAFVASDPVLNAVTTFVHYRPHSELLGLYAETDVQLLVLAHTSIAKGNLPGKLFEYLASGNPIIAIGPVSGDAGFILRQVSAGQIFERTDLIGLQRWLERAYQDWKAGRSMKSNLVNEFSRRALTARLVQIINTQGNPLQHS